MNVSVRSNARSAAREMRRRAKRAPQVAAEVFDQETPKVAAEAEPITPIERGVLRSTVGPEPARVEGMLAKGGVSAGGDRGRGPAPYAIWVEVRDVFHKAPTQRFFLRTAFFGRSTRIAEAQRHAIGQLLRGER